MPDNILEYGYWKIQTTVLLSRSNDLQVTGMPRPTVPPFYSDDRHIGVKGRILVDHNGIHCTTAAGPLNLNELFLFVEAPIRSKVLSSVIWSIDFAVGVEDHIFVDIVAVVHAERPQMGCEEDRVDLESGLKRCRNQA